MQGRPALATDEKLRTDLKNRLNRIEGQVRGVSRMIDDERNCVEVLTQLAAISEGLKKVTLKISEAHAHGCVIRAIQDGEGEQAIEELLSVVFKFAR